jgi:hypothetical protein
MFILPSGWPKRAIAFLAGKPVTTFAEVAEAIGVGGVALAHPEVAAITDTIRRAGFRKEVRWVRMPEREDAR